MPELPASYAEIHRYNGAAMEQGHRDTLIPCAVQPRDVAIVHDVARYKFMTAPQLRELWWPKASIQAADRRLLKLFRAGYIDRFRPVSRPGTGSFPWTYRLGENGHRLLQHADLIPLNRRHRDRLIFDFGHVLHELQLNAWVLAYRRALGDSFLGWEGETTIEPPPGLRPGERLDDDWSAEGLSDPRPRPVCPDAIVEVAGDDPTVSNAVAPHRVRPHPPTRQELREVPPLRHLSHLVVAANTPRRPRSAAVRRLRLPGRINTATTSSPPPTANCGGTGGTPTSHPSATSTSDAIGFCSSRSSTRTRERLRHGGCSRSHGVTQRGRTARDEFGSLPGLIAHNMPLGTSSSRLRSRRPRLSPTTG